MFNNINNIGITKYWHPWKGCHRVSLACKNCFIKNMDNFIVCDLKSPKTNFGECVIVCLHSDFFLEEADEYREQAWLEIKNNPETIFIIITKRVERILHSLPSDWNDGYDNVVISVTVETTEIANHRLEIFKKIPCKHRWISCCPLITKIDLSTFLKNNNFEHIECCGEVGDPKKVRPTYYEFVEHLSNQCKTYNKRFSFMKVGSNFVYQNNVYTERATCYHSFLANACNLDHYIPIEFNLSDKKFIL